MNDPLNPQAEQMTHESMLRTLALQTEAIWPQERLFFHRYDIPASANVIDIACGTGEVTSRLADLYIQAQILGVDVEEQLLRVARKKCESLGKRVQFSIDNAFQLSAADNTFDLTVCRHLLQIIPNPFQAIVEAVRVTKPGGWVHFLSEDYGMIYFSPTELDNDRFWHRGPIMLGKSMGTDMRVGRATYSMFRELGLQDIAVDYVVVDTVRVSREIFIPLWEAWRDGYTDVLADHTEFTREEVAAHWADMLACLHNPNGYAVWQIPVVSGRVPD